ncbi:hypothetical protein PHAVU_008G063100 [Phaseolus vulgaris]|uniref:S-protein homolog n=1 Tax=Phaseolus vulgaris TaxID=3885 RepID=V7B4Q5_PHAVU|nr:hypothetical protein PHAVU_008G063100g [Phaseolus vulgaris]ESW11843.1 hypothetical protein PHAVU_008G063100g [Phaseolus vulgaris]
MSVIVRCVLMLSMLTLAWANHVFITNHLEGKEDLHIHCKSKDDDLGPHVLHINQSFRITFRPNFVTGGTLFFCSFQWGNGHLFHFDVYDQDKNDKECLFECKWYVHKDGPCRNEGDSSVRKCYPWK